MTRKKSVRPAFDESDPYIVRLRKRLWRAYRRLGGWMPLARELGVNVGTVYRFVMAGVVPADPGLRRKLGLRPRRQKRAAFRKGPWYWENALRWK